MLPKIFTIMSLERSWLDVKHYCIHIFVIQSFSIPREPLTRSSFQSSKVFLVINCNGKKQEMQNHKILSIFFLSFFLLLPHLLNTASFFANVLRTAKSNAFERSKLWYNYQGHTRFESFESNVSIRVRDDLSLLGLCQESLFYRWDIIFSLGV